MPRKQEGETCERDIECAYTTGAVFCDHSTATPVCHTLRPTAKAAEGEPWLLLHVNPKIDIQRRTRVELAHRFGVTLLAIKQRVHFVIRIW